MAFVSSAVAAHISLAYLVVVVVCTLCNYIFWDFSSGWTQYGGLTDDTCRTGDKQCAAFYDRAVIQMSYGFILGGLVARGYGMVIELLVVFCICQKCRLFVRTLTDKAETFGRILAFLGGLFSVAGILVLMVNDAVHPPNPDLSNSSSSSSSSSSNANNTHYAHGYLRQEHLSQNVRGKYEDGSTGLIKRAVVEPTVSHPNQAHSNTDRGSLYLTLVASCITTISSLLMILFFSSHYFDEGIERSRGYPVEAIHRRREEMLRYEANRLRTAFNKGLNKIWPGWMKGRGVGDEVEMADLNDTAQDAEVSDLNSNTLSSTARVTLAVDKDVVPHLQPQLPEGVASDIVRGGVNGSVRADDEGGSDVIEETKPLLQEVEVGDLGKGSQKDDRNVIEEAKPLLQRVEAGDLGKGSQKEHTQLLQQKPKMQQKEPGNTETRDQQNQLLQQEPKLEQKELHRQQHEPGNKETQEQQITPTQSDKNPKRKPSLSPLQQQEPEWAIEVLPEPSKPDASKSPTRISAMTPYQKLQALKASRRAPSEKASLEAQSENDSLEAQSKKTSQAPSEKAPQAPSEKVLQEPSGKASLEAPSEKVPLEALNETSPPAPSDRSPQALNEKVCEAPSEKGHRTYSYNELKKRWKAQQSTEFMHTSVDVNLIPHHGPARVGGQSQVQALWDDVYDSSDDDYLLYKFHIENPRPCGRTFTVEVDVHCDWSGVESASSLAESLRSAPQESQHNAASTLESHPLSTASKSYNDEHTAVTANTENGKFSSVRPDVQSHKSENVNNPDSKPTSTATLHCELAVVVTNSDFSLSESRDALASPESQNSDDAVSTLGSTSECPTIAPEASGDNDCEGGLKADTCPQEERAEQQSFVAFSLVKSDVYRKCVKVNS